MRKCTYQIDGKTYIAKEGYDLRMDGSIKTLWEVFEKIGNRERRIAEAYLSRRVTVNAIRAYIVENCTDSGSTIAAEMVEKRGLTAFTPEKRGRPPYGGSPEAAEAARSRRRVEYCELRTALALSPAQLADLIGVSRGTVRLYPGKAGTTTAPTVATIEKMRAAVVRRARKTLEDARVRAEIERENALAEARRHLEMCAVEAEPLDDAA